MISRLSYSLRRGFCVEAGMEKIYDMIFHVKDVTMIKKINTNRPYYIINHKKMQLPQDQLLVDFIKRLDPEESNMVFLDRHMNAYHITTPLHVICQESFYVQSKGYFYFIMNNLPLIEQCESEEFKQTFSTEIIEAVCRESLDQLPENPKEMISGRNMHNLLLENLLKHGMKFKVEKVRYKELLKIVNRKIDSFEEEIREVYVKVEKKSAKTMRRFTNFLLAQYGFVHYLIYFRYSWDILEPVTCILANFDIFCAYYFFIMKGRSWSLGEMHSNYFNQRKFSNLKKYGVDVEKYQQLVEIKKYLEFRLALLSKSPDQLYYKLGEPIAFLNTH